jgi:hypothetical protein
VNARLGASLRAAEAWLLAMGIQDAEISDLLEHLYLVHSRSDNPLCDDR